MAAILVGKMLKQVQHDGEAMGQAGWLHSRWAGLIWGIWKKCLSGIDQLKEIRAMIWSLRAGHTNLTQYLRHNDGIAFLK
jgi:hypothetical protein